MKKNIILIVLILASFVACTQENHHKIDSVAGLVKKYFNEKDADNLYALGGELFQQKITLEKFREVCNNNLFPLAPMQQPVYISMAQGVAKYKAPFTSVTLAMYLSVDDKDKLQTFLFNQYTEDKSSK